MFHNKEELNQLHNCQVAKIKNSPSPKVEVQRTTLENNVTTSSKIKHMYILWSDS